MREFELDRPVDAVSMKVNNSPDGGVRPMAAYVPLVALPVVAAAAYYVGAVNWMWLISMYQLVLATDIKIYPRPTR